MANIRLFFFLVVCCGLLSVLFAASLFYPVIATCVNVRLYAKDASYKEVNIQNCPQLVSEMNLNETTMMFLPGWLEYVDFPTVVDLMKAYLNATNQNVMSVDYGCVSLQPYVTSVALSDDVGMLVAGCIKDMVTAGVDKSKIHLMGLSLGAQICGKAGRLLDFQLSWILGLDPAGPLFENDITGTLNATDAQQVSCIHTDAGFLGTKYPCGGVEFYPNGGTRSQPGCSLTEMIAYANPQIGCSHIRAEFLQTEAVGNQNGFLAVKCDSYDYFKVDACNRSDIIPMGERPPALASGKYYLQTNGQRPYARGIDGTRYNATIDSSTVI